MLLSHAVIQTAFLIFIDIDRNNEETFSCSSNTWK